MLSIFKIIFKIALHFNGHTILEQVFFLREQFRRQIMEELWQTEFDGDERACDVHISNLRQKVERDPQNPELIVTVRGVGYKFEGNGAQVIDAEGGYFELTFGGRSEGKACGSQMQLKKPGHLPPCPKCHKTAFKRG